MKVTEKKGRNCFEFEKGTEKAELVTGGNYCKFEYFGARLYFFPIWKQEGITPCPGIAPNFITKGNLTKSSQIPSKTSETNSV